MDYSNLQREDPKEFCIKCRSLEYELDKQHWCEECRLKNGEDWVFCEYSERDEKGTK